MKIAVTGSSGFIGAELVQYLLQAGHRVVLMQRNVPKEAPHGATYAHFDLNSPQILEVGHLDAMIHCAVATLSKDCPDAEEKNVSATLMLRDHCHSNGIRFVFLSSMSAHADALSVYGRHKFKLEQMMDLQHDTVLKLGLVVGASGGLFKRINDTIASSPFIPMIGGGEQPIQTVSVEEVCQVIHQVVEQERVGLFLLGSERVYSLKKVYGLMAAKRSIHFLKVPYFLAEVLLAFLSLLPIAFPISKENLLGLKCLRPFDVIDDLKRLNVNLRPLEEIIAEIQKKA